MFWLLTLPFRLIVGLLLGVLGLAAGAVTLALLPLLFLLWLPFLLVRGAFRVLGLVACAIAAAIGVTLIAAAVLVPLVPLVLLACAVWIVVRLARPRAFAS
ncbi:MAG: hypothetical protein AB7O32_03020 [Vicinamibacterales bacterium]